MMIEAAYIAHTSYCTDWNLDEILKGSIFKKSARTWRVPSEPVQMLDWDFRRLEARGFTHTWNRHLYLARTNDFEVIMSPDLWHGEWMQASRAYLQLKILCPRVVMPVHVPPPDEIMELEIAWPMGVWTEDHVAIWDVSEQVTHLLGGSPHSQLDMAAYFPNLKTVDGNQAFWCAVRFGKYWDGRWVKPSTPLSNKDCFAESIRNITASWEGK
jgi:hypothetical protein